jgi:hypothetical protein
MDTIGPWTNKVAMERVTFYAFTIIDVVTNLVEIIRCDNKTSRHVAVHYTNMWITRNPKPISCILDQRREFI